MSANGSCDGCDLDLPDPACSLVAWVGEQLLVAHSDVCMVAARRRSDGARQRARDAARKRESEAEKVRHERQDQFAADMAALRLIERERVRTMRRSGGDLRDLFRGGEGTT